MNLQQKIKDVFASAKNRSQYESAFRQIRLLSASDVDLFKVLWPEAIKSQSIDRNVLLSALTLYNLNLRCPIGLKEAIIQMCHEWEISIEEVPWYLAKQFSIEEVNMTVSELNLADNVRGEAILYWIKKYQHKI